MVSGWCSSSSSRRAVAATSSRADGAERIRSWIRRQRLGVGPLRVVHDQQQRRARGQQRAADRAAQPVPQLRLGQRLGRRHLAGQFGQQPGELGQIGPNEPGHPRGHRPGAKPRRRDPVGERAVARIAARLRGHRARVRAQLLDQPGLADARLAGDEHEPRTPGCRRLPGRGQPGPLLVAPDQRRGAGDLAGPVGAGPVALPAGHEGLVEDPGFRRGLDAELVFQRGGAHVVGAHRPGPVPGRPAEPDQQPVVILAEGIARYEALGAADGFGPAVVLLVLAGEPLQRVGVQPGEPFALGGQPVVVTALQQVAGVEPDRFGRPPVGHGPLEPLDIQPQRRVRPPAQRPRPDLDQPVRVRQRAAQRVQDLAQVRLRLALARPGPEQERQALPRLRRVPVEQQVGEQGFGPGRVERRERLVVEPQIHGAEQADTQGVLAHVVLSSGGPADSTSSGYRSGRTGRGGRRRPGRGRGAWRSRT